MAEFAYNNTKNASIDHTPFELDYGYYPRVFFEKDVDLCLKSRFVNKLAKELSIKKGSVYNKMALAFWDAQRDWIRYIA